MTIPPRSLSSLVDPNGHRILRLPNGTCTYIYGDGRWAGEGEGDPLEYLGWAWEWLPRHQVRAEITDLSDEEIRAICMAPAGECEGVIARIAASRKIPRERFRPAIGELSAEAKAARAPLRPEELIEAQHDRVHRDPGRARAARTVRNSRRGSTLGASEPTWEEPEDLVAEPPHYRLPGGREALEDVIAPICDALSERRLPGSAVFMVGNALKYLARLGAKGSALEDLRKAREYLDRAIARMTAE